MYRRRMLVLAGVSVMLMLTGCAATAVEGEGEGGASNTNAAGDLVVGGETLASADLYQCAKDEGLVSVYTATPGGSDEFWKAFTADTGLPVNGLVLPTETLTARIDAERAAKQLNVDVIDVADVALWETFVSEGIIQANPIPSRADIPDTLSDPSAPYTARMINLKGTAYNTQTMKGDPPKTWADLLDPRFKGKIAIKPISAGAEGWEVALFMYQQLGPDYWAKFAAQQPVLETSSNAAAEAVARGEVDIAITDLAALKTVIETGAPLKLAWLTEGTPGLLVYIGQVTEDAGSQHPCAGQIYVNWSLSKRGQDVTAKEIGTYPVNTTAISPSIGDVELPSQVDVKASVATKDDWINLRDEYTKEWNQIFGVG